MGGTDGPGAPAPLIVAPLIVSLALDAGSFARLDAERRRHFPPARNVIPAHLTLFHALPGDEEPLVAARLREAARDHPPVRLVASGLRFLGRGVAHLFDAPELKRLRADLAGAFAPWLTPQDAGGFHPHVTVQNKADPAAARALHAAMTAAFAPFEARGEALELWRYRGGPWEAAGRFPFEGAPTA